MRTPKRPKIRSFKALKGNGYFYLFTPSEKYRVREVIKDLNRVFIPKKVNEEYD